jgi:hypothetical protein
MRTRIVAVIGAAAVALGLIAAVLVGTGYSYAFATEPDDTSEFTPPPRPPETIASTSPALPTIDDIPEGLSDEEYAHAVEWLTWSGMIDDCMEDAGFPEWFYQAYWQVKEGSWPDAFDDVERLHAAALALGGNPGSGADYRWQDAGCQGAATEALGISS